MRRNGTGRSFQPWRGMPSGHSRYLSRLSISFRNPDHNRRLQCVPVLQRDRVLPTSDRRPASAGASRRVMAGRGDSLILCLPCLSCHPHPPILLPFLRPARSGPALWSWIRSPLPQPPGPPPANPPPSRQALPDCRLCCRFPSPAAGDGERPGCCWQHCWR